MPVLEVPDREHALIDAALAAGADWTAAMALRLDSKEGLDTVILHSIRYSGPRAAGGTPLRSSAPEAGG
jgi:hypothetical protein